jgi:hypothetical protein
MTQPHPVLDPNALVHSFVGAFATEDTSQLSRHLRPEVVFRDYGDGEVHGRDALLQGGAGVFTKFAGPFRNRPSSRAGDARNGNRVVLEER